VGRLDLPVVDLTPLPADQRPPEAQRLFDDEAIGVLIWRKT